MISRIADEAGQPSTIRWRLVEHVRDQIRRGVYVTPEKLSVASERLALSLDALPDLTDSEERAFDALDGAGE